MHSSIQQKEKKIVPRFRRKNINKNIIDVDDEEAQALIDKDLQSHFKWTSDTIEDSKYQFDQYQDNQQQQQQISIIDIDNNQFIYDIDNNNNQQLWNINIQDNENNSVKWIDDQQQKVIHLNIESIQYQQQKWSLNENNQKLIQLNLNEQLNNKYHLDTINTNTNQIFIKGEEFRHQIEFSIGSSDENLNIFPNDSEDIRSISIDSNIPSINSILSLPQSPIIVHRVEGISQYTLSLPDENLSAEYSPLSETIKLEIDSKTLISLKWSLEILKENLIDSYLISLPSTDHNQLSIPDIFYLKFSIDEENTNKQLFSIIDYSFKQIISLSSNDIKDQLLTIIDSIKIKQNFGNEEDKILICQWSLNELKNIIFNISPKEFIHFIYSPNDVKPIHFTNLIIDSDEGSARAFRRHRCKYLSIKNDQKDQLDSLQTFNLQFKGNELIAIGEQQIQNDLDEQQQYRDVTTNKILLEEDFPQSYDIKIIESSPSNIGPCLFRSDYEVDPPKTWSSLRREIGYISFDGSLEEPIYYLDKSFKSFVHIPLDRQKCCYNVYKGYQQFIEKVRLNSSNYFRPFDSIDLRHLLNWYSQKQYLFSSNDQNLLKPPTFICRRTVLRTIIANLYCDSDPWKLLVIRIKGQFYLALANKATKKVEDMTEDEYSGYNFEQLFKTDQPNTTRFKDKIPLEKPQQGFHTVQYWQFGQFNILYSNEIDGEYIHNNQQKSETNNINKQEDNSTKPTETSESKPIETDSTDKVSLEVTTDSWSGEIPSEIENVNEEIEDESKEKQINENLELIKTDENEPIEKKKRNEFELKSGYVEMKCTNKKIFYRDDKKLETLHWWAQMWLANVNTLMIGYKTSNNGIINQIDLISIQQLIYKFLSKYDLKLKYCFSYLYSFLNLIQKTILIDDQNTIHAFAYIPQPLDIDQLTGKTLQTDLPNSVPFRYTQIKRSNQRHKHFMPIWYLQHIQRTILNQDKQFKTIEEETKKRIGHRGRSNCLLKQKQNKHKK